MSDATVPRRRRFGRGILLLLGGILIGIFIGMSMDGLAGRTALGAEPVPSITVTATQTAPVPAPSTVEPCIETGGFAAQGAQLIRCVPPDQPCQWDGGDPPSFYITATSWEWDGAAEISFRLHACGVTSQAQGEAKIIGLLSDIKEFDVTDSIDLQFNAVTLSSSYLDVRIGEGWWVFPLDDYTGGD